MTICIQPVYSMGWGRVLRCPPVAGPWLGGTRDASSNQHHTCVDYISICIKYLSLSLQRPLCFVSSPLLIWEPSLISNNYHASGFPLWHHKMRQGPIGAHCSEDGGNKFPRMQGWGWKRWCTSQTHSVAIPIKYGKKIEGK